MSKSWVNGKTSCGGTRQWGLSDYSKNSWRQWLKLILKSWLSTGTKTQTIHQTIKRRWRGNWYIIEVKETHHNSSRYLISSNIPSHGCCAKKKPQTESEENCVLILEPSLWLQPSCLKSRPHWELCCVCTRPTPCAAQRSFSTLIIVFSTWLWESHHQIIKNDWVVVQPASSCSSLLPFTLRGCLKNLKSWIIIIIFFVFVLIVPEPGPNYPLHWHLHSCLSFSPIPSPPAGPWDVWWRRSVKQKVTCEVPTPSPRPFDCDD